MELSLIDLTDALPSPLCAFFSAYNTVLEVSVTISDSLRRKLRLLSWDELQGRKEGRHFTVNSGGVGAWPAPDGSRAVLE